jgi:stage II sporulation protein P
MKKKPLKLFLVAACMFPFVFFMVSCAPSILDQPDEELFIEINENSGNITVDEQALEAIKPAAYKYDYAPTVLIYYTHATEAFRQEGDYTYQETSAWRTDDNEKNIVRVGEELKEQLEKLGFDVIHDTKNVEPPELRTAYSRSLTVMQSYPQADIFIDVHRNAADVKTASDDVVLMDGVRYARMFFVVGTGVGTYEGEYDETPNWRENYAFAKAVKQELDGIDENLTTKTRIKVGRYNQHMGKCLLVEIGHNANTLSDALNSVPFLAEAIKHTVNF